VVERLLAKEKVVGSNPIARSGSWLMADGRRQTAADGTIGDCIGYLLSAICFHAEVAQLVEHATENCGVPSSSLGLGT
jgi:hypothetical protein